MVIRRALRQQSVRFVAVGLVNTVVGFVLYGLLLLLFADVRFGYLLSLGLSWAVSITIAFFLYRRFVFVVRGNLVVDYLRFVTVYLVNIAINAVGLAALVEILSVAPLLAQLIMLIITTGLSYVGHRWFSFRRSPVLRPSDGARRHGAEGNE